MNVPVGSTANPANSTLQEALVDGFNLTVLGKTQTGKTSFMRELHATTPRTVSIFFNEQGDDRVPNIASEGKPVRSVEGVRQALSRNQLRINFLSADRHRDAPELRRLLWDLSDRADRQLSMQVLTDEIHRLAPQTNEADHAGRDAVRRFHKEGVKRGIKFVDATQDPTAMDKGSLRQTEYRLVFTMSNENRNASAVKDMGLNWDAIDDGPRYSGALHHDSGRVLERNVQASERFA